MFDQTNHLQNELAELIDRHTDKEGYRSTAIPYLGFSRYSTSHYSTLAGPPYGLYNPSLGIVVQGTKDVILGGVRFRYGPSNYFVTSMDLPIIFEAPEASPQVPNLACKIEFTPSLILEILGTDAFKVTSKKTPKQGMYVAKLDVSMLDAVVRLVRLLDKPDDIPILAPLYTKEILYKALRGEQGDSIRRIVMDRSPTIHIQNAIQHILQHFHDSLRIEDLAGVAKMSIPSFHRHFKEVTAMSPIQFQKQLRLQEARRLIISESMDVANAAFQVGYESPTQFSREYSRMFGFPPREEEKKTV
ncbi:transcriptional regulator [Pullulanibacillus camelliae]|uniref:Transcriptional regulator n=1 Tax=Pullulanibacillus camelliae TaxID=1707096 RepID=A0A8J2YMW9_9BACL|nr:AraC family transcriptional regulator [Pullulanibacillus camelliae]GGE55816.1 transcriptional regulator [Pullulanibacillus camelliae]